MFELHSGCMMNCAWQAEAVCCCVALAEACGNCTPGAEFALRNIFRTQLSRSQENSQAEGAVTTRDQLETAREGAKHRCNDRRPAK